MCSNRNNAVQNRFKSEVQISKCVKKVVRRLGTSEVAITRVPGGRYRWRIRLNVSRGVGDCHAPGWNIEFKNCLDYDVSQGYSLWGQPPHFVTVLSINNRKVDYPFSRKNVKATVCI